jgi:hypothetical protein
VIEPEVTGAAAAVTVALSETDTPVLAVESDKASVVVVAAGVNGGVDVLPPPPEQPMIVPANATRSACEGNEARPNMGIP